MHVSPVVASTTAPVVQIRSALTFTQTHQLKGWTELHVFVSQAHSHAVTLRANSAARVGTPAEGISSGEHLEGHS